MESKGYRAQATYLGFLMTQHVKCFLDRRYDTRNSAQVTDAL